MSLRSCYSRISATTTNGYTVKRMPQALARAVLYVTLALGVQGYASFEVKPSENPASVFVEIRELYYYSKVLSCLLAATGVMITLVRRIVQTSMVFALFPGCVVPRAWRIKSFVL